MHFDVYLFFLFQRNPCKEKKRKRDTHDNHVLAAKHRKIIWHDLVFLLYKRAISTTTTTTTKMYLPHKNPISFQKHNTWLVFYLMARGGI